MKKRNWIPRTLCFSDFRPRWRLAKTVKRNYKKRRLYRFIFYNLKRLSLTIKNFFLIMVRKKLKNIFLSYSNLFNGNVLLKKSCGHYFKRSIKKTYYAADALLNKTKIPITNRRTFIFVNIRGLYFHRGFKRALKKFFSNFKYKICKINNIKFSAHNGVRLKAKRRK